MIGVKRRIQINQVYTLIRHAPHNFEIVTGEDSAVPEGVFPIVFYVRLDNIYNFYNTILGRNTIPITEFRLEKKLPPCRVTKDLLESLEEYILDKRDKIGSDIDNPPRTDEFTITIADNLGEESVNSTQQLKERFFSSTTEVTIEFYARWYEKGDTLQLTIKFSNTSYRLSTVTIRSKSDTARELAAGMSNSIDEIMQNSKTSNWLFYPPVWISFPIFMVSVLFLLLGILLLVMSIESEEYVINYMFWRSVLFSGVGFAYLYFGPKLHPYTIFDSPRADQLQSISRFYKSALVAFLLSAIAFPFLSKALFGQ